MGGKKFTVRKHLAMYNEADSINILEQAFNANCPSMVVK